jgi:hypothetical protein
MSAFRRSASRLPQTLNIPSIRFLGQQAGPSERLLERKLMECFSLNLEVRTAYLARVAYPDRPEVGVALCLGMRSGSPERSQEALVKEVGSAFASIFNEREHLDIIFLNESQEAELAQICSRFFSRD